MATWEEKEASIRALEKDGAVDVDDLIEAAKSPTHPCHECFTWDIEKAAQERWRDQGRELLRQVKFDVEYGEATQRVVMYVPNSGDEHKHRSVPKIRSKNEAREVLLVEVRQLHGIASRVYGIALAKRATVGREGDEIVKDLLGIRDAAAAVKAVLGG